MDADPLPLRPARAAPLERRHAPWIARIADGNFAATVLSLGGTGHGWLAIPRVSVPRSELLIAAAAVVAWLVVERGAPELLRVDALVHQSWGALAALLLALVDRHTKWALLLALAVVLLESARWLRSTGNTALRPSTTSLVRKRSSGP